MVLGGGAVRYGTERAGEREGSAPGGSGAKRYVPANAHYREGWHMRLSRGEQWTLKLEGMTPQEWFFGPCAFHTRRAACTTFPVADREISLSLSLSPVRVYIGLAAFAVLAVAGVLVIAGGLVL